MIDIAAGVAQLNAQLLLTCFQKFEKFFWVLTVVPKCGNNNGIV